MTSASGDESIPSRGRVDVSAGEPVAGIVEPQVDPGVKTPLAGLAEPPAAVEPGDWFLSAQERDNPDTTLDSRHPGSRAWTLGNDVRPLIHGATYFRVLLRTVEALEAGDMLLFTDWRGDPAERLDGPGTEVGKVFAAAAARGVDVRGLLWFSHRVGGQFSTAQNQNLGDVIADKGGQFLLDMRVRRLGSHHQKLVVVRHRSRPADDVAFVGGIDLCHGRRDDSTHTGDPQILPMADVYGARPPWHDIQLEIRGPAVGDAETVFRERWEDSTPLTRSPTRLLNQALHRNDLQAEPMPPQLPDPPPAGQIAVQLLRTYPDRRPGYPFASRGEDSIARGYRKSIGRARSLVYIEDQYLWSTEVTSVFAKALRREPELRMIYIIPQHPDVDGRFSKPPFLAGREAPLKLLRAAGGDRVAVYGIENQQGTPIYVHAKACIVDDEWACVGSDNANLRSWTHDSELSAAFIHPTDPAAEEGSARSLRLALAREHLGTAADGWDLDHPIQWFEAFRATARALDGWHDGGRVGPRPPGQLRMYRQEPMGRFTRWWATPVYRIFFDPDGRSRRKRRQGRF